MQMQRCMIANGCILKGSGDALRQGVEPILGFLAELVLFVQIQLRDSIDRITSAQQQALQCADAGERRDYMRPLEEKNQN